MTLEDIDSNAFDAMMADDADMLLFGGPGPTPSSKGNHKDTSSSLRRLQLSRVQREALEKKRQEEKDADRGASTAAGYVYSNSN